MFGSKASRHEKPGLRAFMYLCLDDGKRLEVGGHGFPAGSTYKKPSPSIFLAEGMDDDGIIT
jgi:hypothetical protein